MTIGKRIAQKRKALGLSQEALGDRLHVSRQTVYKWESDASIPEVEKLIALSQLFGVTVDWLLGVEETVGPADTLTQTQLQMVEQIAARYLDAQPKPPRRRGRRIIWVAAATIVTCMLLLQQMRLGQLESNYQSLQNSIFTVSSTVDTRIGGITSRVEEILQAQNSLLADYEISEPALDPAAGTACYLLSATPKTYTPGMTATFVAQSGGERVECSGQPSEGQSFQADLTCPLTDEITLSVVFSNGDTQQTQVLQTDTGLLYQTFPEVYLYADILDGSILSCDGNTMRTAQIHMWMSPPPADSSVTQVTSCEVGLFCNKTLIAWAEPCEQPSNYHGFDDAQFYELAPMDLPYQEGDVYTAAARITDEYGRVFLLCSDLYVCTEQTLERSIWLDGEAAQAVESAYSANYSPGPLDGWSF